MDKPRAGAASVPLCVDLDGTLLRTDMAYESFLALLAEAPLCALSVPFWAAGGLGCLKRRIAERITIDPETLPYHRGLLEYLSQERRSGRRLILATATDELIARRIADHLGLFQDVIASDGSFNCKGREKLAAIRSRLGDGPFDYAGDSWSDLPVWEKARDAVLVEPSRCLARMVERRARVARVFQGSRPSWREWARLMRPHQWVKNLLLFVPAITSHRIFEGDVFAAALCAFAAFSLCASSAYVINDLLDLPADRRHPRKKDRPLASGSMEIQAALPLALALLLGAFGAAGIFLSRSFQEVLAGYFGATLLYSFFLKRLPLLDVFSLSALYTIRLLAGHAATGIPISPWLIAFCLFLFLSLSMLKRYGELRNLEGCAAASGRAYEPEDGAALLAQGVSSGFVAVLVFALYINSEQVRLLYRRIALLWLVCPLLLYWLGWLWLTAQRRRLDDDPVLFCLKDRASYACAALIAVIMAAAAR